MASVDDVTAAGRQVRDKLQEKIDDGRYSADDRNAFSTAHLVFSRKLAAFSLQPAHGSSSPAYDPTLAAQRAATQALDQCQPDAADTIAHALVAVDQAGDALAAVTGAIQTSFTSALAVRRAPRRVIAPVRGGGPQRAPGAGNGTGGEPTEPYLTSLAKLFPAESLSALLLVLSIDAKFSALRYTLIAIIALATVLLRYFTARDPVTKKPDLLAIGISLISFLIYAIAMLAFGPIFGDEPTTRIVATVFAILWMAILTNVIRNTPAPPA